MIYVYAVMTPPTQELEVTGLEDARIECRPVDGVTLAVSRLADGPPLISDAAVLRHAQVVDALTQTSASVLPARFGLAYGDELSLERSVHERSEELSAALDRVRGCVELGLRVLAPERGDAPVAATGGDYLRARLRESAAHERLAHALHAALRPLARDAHQSAPSGQLVLSAAYLVPAGTVDAFRREVETLELSHPELAFVCTGPWPPYSFAPSAGTREADTQ